MTQTQMRQILIAVAALMVVALAGAGLAAALRAPQTGGTPQSQSPGPGATQQPSSAPSSDEAEADDDDDDGDSGDRASGDDAFYGDTVTDSAEGDDEAEFSSGLGVRIVDVKKVELKGEGIGATSGPGVEVTIELRNNTGKKASLAAVVVNAYSGKERTPATPVETTDGFDGSLAKGATKRGTYTFGTPKDAALFIAVSTAADSGVVVLEHR